MSDSLDNEINREFCAEILETLGNRTYLSIPKDNQTGKFQSPLPATILEVEE